MTKDKFESETSTLKKFLEKYCHDKHLNQVTKTQNIIYQNSSFKLEVNLCKECLDTHNYSIEKLQNCPHEQKPRCRKCPNPCYEKLRWKTLAKIMRYSGFKFGLLELKNRLFS